MVDVATAACPYCGVGCLLDVTLKDGRVAGIRGNVTAQANQGRICPKGALLGEVIDTSDRLKTPLLRIDEGGVYVPISWDAALDLIASKIASITQSAGPNAVGFYGSGQLDTEAWYLAGKLFKGVIGTNNIDSNSRLCMASAVAGYRTSLGSDGPPACYEDIDLADTLFIVGANMAEAHPVLFDRIKARKRREGDALTVVVVDPRRTPTADLADFHVQLKPGGDIALFNAVARRLIEMGCADAAFIEEHAEGWEEYAAFVQDISLERSAVQAGVGVEVIEKLAGILGRAGNLLSLYCMGTNQSTVGMWKNNSLINLHLLLGQIGKAGAGPFSLTGQPNAMGGREAGALAHMLPGYRLIENAADRAEMEAFWELPPGRIQSSIGLTAVEMFRALERRSLRMLWIAGTNPAVSMPDLNQTGRALRSAEFVVVQDCYHPTETTRQAHLILPVAQWGEKDGTSTNSERTVTYSPAFLEPPGEARPDWWILAEVGRRLAPQAFSYAGTAEVWDEFRQTTRGRPCDQNGITRARLTEGPLQWPCPDEESSGAARRYLDRTFATPSGRARFLPRTYRPPNEQADHEFPLVLTTGRIASQWHSRTRTGKVAKLASRDPEPYVEIHPDDALQRGIEDRELVVVASRRGWVRVKSRLSDRVPPGMVFLPFHWGDLYDVATAANYLTNPVIGRVSKEPEFKYCAVEVEKLSGRAQVP